MKEGIQFQLGPHRARIYNGSEQKISSAVLLWGGRDYRVLAIGPLAPGERTDVDLEQAVLRGKPSGQLGLDRDDTAGRTVALWAEERLFRFETRLNEPMLICVMEAEAVPVDAEVGRREAAVLWVVYSEEPL